MYEKNLMDVELNDLSDNIAILESEIKKLKIYSYVFFFTLIVPFILYRHIKDKQEELAELKKTQHKMNVSEINLDK